MSDWVKEVTDATFETEVVQRSLTVPVVVDFWAPWCAPCRTLGPVLERLAAENAGAFVLAKVNIDENPGVAQSFGVRSIPAVKAIAGGEIVDEFVGAVPEAMAREFIHRILPTEADRLVAEGLGAERRGTTAEAEALYRKALGMDANHPGGRLGLGRILAGSDPQAALRELERVLPGTPERDEADRLAARLRIGGADAGEETELAARVTKDPGDLEARLKLARLLAAREEHSGALQHLLEVIKRDRTFQDEAARKAMLDIFEILGPRHALTEKYRGELARVLFS